MPSLDRDRPAAGPIVQGFSGQGFRIDGVVYDTGVKLTPEGATPWRAPRIDLLGEADLADLLDLAPTPEFILLGTGLSLKRPSPALVHVFETRGSGIEMMDSRAAARAWGVLRGEGRWIAAALMPLDDR